MFSWNDEDWEAAEDFASRALRIFESSKVAQVIARRFFILSRCLFFVSGFDCLVFLFLAHGCLMNFVGIFLWFSRIFYLDPLQDLGLLP